LRIGSVNPSSLDWGKEVREAKDAKFQEARTTHDVTTQRSGPARALDVPRPLLDRKIYKTHVILRREARRSSGKSAEPYKKVCYSFPGTGKESRPEACRRPPVNSVSPRGGSYKEDQDGWKNQLHGVPPIVLHLRIASGERPIGGRKKCNWEA